MALLRAATITGPSSVEDLRVLVEALDRFQFVEVGVLHCASLMGKKRYFPSEGVLKTINASGVRLSCHLSGGNWLGDVCAGQLPPEVDFTPYRRVQLNLSGASPTPGSCRPFRPRPLVARGLTDKFGNYLDLISTLGPDTLGEAVRQLPASVCEVILQVAPDESRGYPELFFHLANTIRRQGRKVSLLFDSSGGRGLFSPQRWPDPPPLEIADCGYAGGLNADRIQGAIEHLQRLVPAGRSVWVDMQSGARGPDGAMDRDLIERFLVACEKTIKGAI